jgi:RHS repeat-associated protein
VTSVGGHIFIYGPIETSIEQINTSTGTVEYLHHDQAGSTRLLTGSTGKTEATFTYGPYGAPTCEGASTTPLGYDGQYTSSDTGLIYMRARVYDLTAAQFLTVDPLVSVTRAPYNYAADNPVNERDRTGLEEGGYCVYPVGCVSGPGGGGGGSGGLEAVKEIAKKTGTNLKAVPKG